MKRLFLTGIMGLLAIGVFAQNWTIDGNIYLEYSGWENSSKSEDSKSISLILSFGRYLTEKLNVGLRAGVGFADTGNSITVGPRIKYDFLQYDKVLLSAFGSVYYTKFNGSYPWNDFFPDNDAHRIRFAVAPSVSYLISNNVEAYLQFAELTFLYDWLTLKGTDIACTTKALRLAGVVTSPSFGVLFKF